MCKPPIKRTSPLGRDICDLMIAVNRMYNKSDYIPCIAWGRNANYADNLKVGTKVYLEGRIQSREYKKKFEDGTSEIRKALRYPYLSLRRISRARMKSTAENTNKNSSLSLNFKAQYDTININFYL